MTETEQIRITLRAQAGDRDSLETLLRALQRPLWAYVAGLVGPTSADDVLQELLLQICRDLKWLRDPTLLTPWSYRIASRCSFKWLKRNRRFVQTAGDTFSLEEVAAPDANERQLFTTLPEFLGQVSPASRAVLTLHYLHERSLEEVAAILEINLGTVKSRLAYGLTCLRECVNRKGAKL